MNAKSQITAHLQIFQILGSLPLILNEPSFSEVARPFLAVPLILTVACVAILLLQDPPDVKTAGQATKQVFISCNVAICALPIVHTVNIIKLKYNFEDTINDLMWLQRRLGIHKSSYFQDNAPMLVTMMFLILGSFTVHDYSDGKYTMSSFALDLFWNYYYLYVLSICLQLSYLQHSIGKCFQKLKRMETIWVPGHRQLVVKDAIKHHHTTSDISCDVEKIYHWSVSLILLILFCSTLAMTAVLITGKAVDIYSAGQYAIWASHHVLLAAHVLGSCQFITERAEECNNALLRYIIHDKSGAYQANALVMIHLSSRKTLQFTACKCVNVDYRLGLSMIAAFLTYIVVLFQIENPKATIPSTVVAPMLSTTNRT